jgi:voltage-gated potassium channel
MTPRPLTILLQFITILIVLFGLHCISFKYFESVSYNESFWQTWQTFTTVGYGNRPAESVGCRTSSVLFATFGIAILGAVFSSIFDLKQYYKDKRRLGKMVNKFKAGYVIVNYPGECKAINVINELREVEPNVPVCFKRYS